ncbi:MAG TPA: DUF6524 family protein [Steroidobacteraceae bacterium]|nr:DUF6524 family protein [Steroidobacteraceae bacterium]
MNNNTMSAGGALARMLAAQALVLLTANPSGHSYFHWVAGVFPHLTALQAVCGLLLLIVWVVYATATLRSLGWLGVGLVVALFAALIWLAVSQGWLHLTGGTAWSWLALITTGLVLGIGMCWSFARRRLSGHADVDEVHGP